MEISSNKSKKYRQQHRAKDIYQHTDERTNARRSGPVQILRLYIKQIRDISKRGKCQTGASARSHDKAGNSVEKQSNQFSTKVILDMSLFCRCLIKHYLLYYGEGHAEDSNS